MPVTKGLQDLFEEAMAEIETLNVEETLTLYKRGAALLIDIRDIRELWREGTIPDSEHAPRGMLEAWLDPNSPYHRAVFATDKKLVFFCAGGVRSALAAKTAQEMGLDNVAHVGGGFAAWKMAEAPIQAVEPKINKNS